MTVLLTRMQEPHDAAIEPRSQGARFLIDDQVTHEPTAVAQSGKPKSDTRRMTRLVAFRLDEATYGRLERMVNRSGSDKVNDWSRTAVLSAIGQSDISDMTLRRMAGELGKVGSRIEKQLRSTGRNNERPDKSDLHTTVKEMRDLIRKIALTLP